MADLLITIITLYVAFFIVELINKLGHVPQSLKFERALPIPTAVAYGSSFKWGGMLSYAIMFIGVWFYKPQFLLLQLIGWVSWILFMGHAILGSLNFELPIPKRLLGIVVKEEIPNDLWWVFIPLAIATFIYFGNYYLGLIDIFIKIPVVVTQ